MTKKEMKKLINAEVEKANEEFKVYCKKDPYSSRNLGRLDSCNATLFEKVCA